MRPAAALVVLPDGRSGFRTNGIQESVRPERRAPRPAPWRVPECAAKGRPESKDGHSTWPSGILVSHLAALLVALALALALAPTSPAARAADDEGESVCASTSRCHGDHPEGRIDCPACGRRRIPENDASCLACASRQKSCRHCGRPLAARAGERAAASRGFAEVAARVEQIGETAFVSFQPVLTAELRVNRPARSVTVYGVEGEVRGATFADGVIRLPAPARVAELALADADARGLQIAAPAAALAQKPEPLAPGAIEPIGAFKPTFYWVLLEEKFDGERDTPLTNHDGTELGRFAADFVKKAKIEGTAKLRDGRVINVWGKGTWKVVDAPNGLGTKGYHLIPFRSVAVDKEQIPVGTPLYIPEAVGMALPDGTLHDGRFWAHDVGGGIKGKRIDLFTGLGRRQDVFAAAGILNMKAVTVYRVKEEAGR